MPTIDFEIISGRQRSDLKQICSDMVKPLWPPFMLEDPVAEEHWGDLYELFPDYQFAIMEKGKDNILASANSIPFHWDNDPYALPDEGWDWVLKQGVMDGRAGVKPTVMSAIQVAIPEEYRESGLASMVVEIMREIGARNGCQAMFAPVRPTLKHLYPLVPIDRYMRWEDDEGLPFDPWMRVHARLGAEIIKPCPRAMQIEGTIEDWEKWTDMAFPESGRYVVPEALVPVEIDRENNRGLYIEPNIWMGHAIR